MKIIDSTSDITDNHYNYEKIEESNYARKMGFGGI